MLSGLSYAGVEEHEVLQRLRGLAFGLLDEHARREGKPRWAEKTAFDSFYIREIDRIFGDHCDFVCLLRHGLDVAVSMQEFCDRVGEPDRGPRGVGKGVRILDAEDGAIGVDREGPGMAEDDGCKSKRTKPIS